MKTGILLFLLIILSGPLVAQVDSSRKLALIDTTAHLNHRHPIIPGLIITEAFIFGTSAWAADTESHGDKVMGWFYAAGSAAMLIITPLYWTGKENNKDPDFKQHRIWNAVIMLGMSYGFSRIATYNLLQADGDSRSTRMTRNVIESHAAFIVPMLAGALTRHLVFKNKPTSKVQTRVQFTGTSLHLTMAFK